MLSLKVFLRRVSANRAFRKFSIEEKAAFWGNAGTSVLRTLLTQNPDVQVTGYDRNTNISFLGCGIALTVGEGPAFDYHKRTYGENSPYENFLNMWKAENGRPSEWAALMEQTGARYTVITTKYHDGFCLLPSQYTPYNTAERGPMRDSVGELKEAVENRGIRFETYYSGLVDWTFAGDPIFVERDLYDCASPTDEYCDYACKQATELIDRYHPAIFWNDIGWPVKGNNDLKYLFAHYDKTVEEGGNDRWNDLWWDFKTQEDQYGSPVPGSFSSLSKTSLPTGLFSLSSANYCNEAEIIKNGMPKLLTQRVSPY